MFRVVRKIRLILDKKQEKKIVILFFMMLIGAFLEVAGVSLILPLVSAIMNPSIIETNMMVKQICKVFGLHSHRTFVILCIAALILVFIIKDLFLIVQYSLQYRFIYNNRFAMQQKLLGIFLKRPYEYYLDAQSGEIMRIIQGDVAATYDLLTTLLSFATEFMVTLVLSVTIFLVDPFMTICVAGFVGGAILVVSKVIKPTLTREGLVYQKHMAIMSKWLLQSLTGIKELKVMQKERFFQENYVQSGYQTIRAERKKSVLGQTPRLIIEMVSVCSMLAMIAIMIYRGREIETLIPTLSAFAMAAVKLLPSANRIVGALNAIAYQEPSLDMMVDNLKTFATSDDVGGVQVNENQNERERAKGIKKASPITLKKGIMLKSISYAYPNSEQKVLSDAQMLVPAGKSVGIVGASGAGKTTAVDIILGLLIPQKGQVLVDGIDVQENYSDWLMHIGYIPQSIFMLDDSIRANVAFGVDKDKIDDEQVWHALKEAQMEEFIKTLPEEINTQIGERGVRLSGGQRQRIGIARALYSNPELLIFDEATSALDNETEAAIMESINKLHGKKTMIIIAHRLQTIEACDVVYRVVDGKIERER